MTSPAAARNIRPILDVLQAHLPACGHVLEIAAGSGEHALALSTALPGLEWTPSDPSPDARTSIAAWRNAKGPANLNAPVGLDMTAPDWSGFADAGAFSAMVCINMAHISPWRATEGLMDGAARLLRPGGLLYLYGPWREAEKPLAPSNAAFDADLKARNPEWGLREIDAAAALARNHGLIHTLKVSMPANNLSLLFRRI